MHAVWSFTAAILLASPLAPAPAEWHEGLSATSVGRFGWWPSRPVNNSAGSVRMSEYEENLVARVHSDQVERSVLGLDDRPWALRFGLGVAPDAAVDSVRVESLSWASKTWTAFRAGTEQRLSVNALSPGIWLESAEANIRLASDDTLGFIAYSGAAGVAVVDLADPPGGGPAYEGRRDGAWGEGWLLIWQAAESSLPGRIPVLLTLASNPDRIEMEGDELAIRFVSAIGDSLRAVLSLPYGVAALDPAEVALWSTALPDSVTERCRLLADMAVHWPDEVTERYSIDEAAGRVEIRDHFRYRPLRDQWQSAGRKAASLPPLVAFARDQGHDVRTPDPGLAPLGYPTRSGPLEVVLDSDSLSFSLPLAPRHNIHLVGSELAPTDWVRRTRCAIDRPADELVWDLDKSWGGGAWSAATMHGRFAALLTTDNVTRGRFIHKVREILDWITLDFGPGGPYNTKTEPTTGHSYHWLTHAGSYPHFPMDQDVVGANLEFIWEYGLFSGDWWYLENNWTEIQNIFEYLHLVNDWAYLASSCRDWGGCGSFLDMFPAQWMGYVAYANIAAVLGHGEDEREGRYLASRALLPLTARFQFEPYLTRYFPFDHENRIVSGFGESEPAGVLENSWCGHPNNSIVDWADKTISGERFHPLVYEAYARLVPDAFTQILSEGEALNGADFNFEHGQFEDNHVYAFWKMGWGGTWLAEKWAQLHAAEQSHSSNVKLFGPNLGDPNAFMMSLVGNEDIPVALGSWEPGVVEAANYLRGSGELRVHLRNLFATTTPLSIVSPEQPTQATLDGAPVGWTYDPLWDLVTIPVDGAGLHSIALHFPFQAPDPPTPDPPDSNLALNPGFEESGVGNSNYTRPWILYNNKNARAVLDEFRSHSGDHSMRLHAYAAHDTIENYVSVFQNIYFGEEKPFTVSFWYSIPFSIPDSTFSVTVQLYEDRHDAESSSTKRYLPVDQYPIDDQWHEMRIAVDDTLLLQGKAICRLGFGLREATSGSIYLDDLKLVSPALTTPCDLDLEALSHPAFVSPGGVLRIDTRAINRCESAKILDELTFDTAGPADYSVVIYQRAPLEVAAGGEQLATISLQVPLGTPLGLYDIDLSIASLGVGIDTESIQVEVW